MEMHKLISRLEKNEPCDIILQVSMELNNATYQPYYCKGEPGTIKAFKDEGIIRFTVQPFTVQPLRLGKKFQVKITLEGSEIFFSADRIYDDPTRKFKLELSFEKKIYVLTGIDDRDNIELLFSFHES